MRRPRTPQLAEGLAQADLGGPTADPAAEDERRTERVVHRQTPMCAATLAAPSHPRVTARRSDSAARRGTSLGSASSARASQAEAKLEPFSKAARSAWHPALIASTCGPLP